MILTKARVRMGSYMALLVALLGFFFLHALVEERGGSIGWLPLLLFTVILFATLGGATETRRQLYVMICLFASLAAAEVAVGLLDSRAAWILARGLHLAFMLYAVRVILGHVFRTSAVTSDMILGSVCGYLLLGFVFHDAYLLLEELQPGSFRGAADIAGSGGYFSLVTLTTLGYGDTVPVKAVARSLAAIEAVVGQFYIAVIVARLVAAHYATHGRQAKEGR